MKIIAGAGLLLAIAALVVAIIGPGDSRTNKPRDHTVNRPILEMPAPELPRNPFQLLPNHVVPNKGEPERENET